MEDVLGPVLALVSVIAVGCFFRIALLEKRLDARIDAVSGRVDQHIDRPVG